MDNLLQTLPSAILWDMVVRSSKGQSKMPTEKKK